MKDIDWMDEQVTVFDRIADLILLIAFLVLVFLKLFNVIQLSWFWVLSPIWFFSGIAIILFLITTIMDIISFIKEKKNERN